MKATRREFMSTSVLGVAGAGMALTGASNVLAAAQNIRAYQPGKCVILLDGVAAGVVSSAELNQGTGGQTGTTTLQKTPTGGVKTNEIAVQCGAGMSKNFYDWIKSATQKQGLRKSGALLVCDFNDNEVARMEFTNAAITEIGFPALDAASKEAAKMTIKFTPETIHLFNKPGGKYAAGVSPKAKIWMASNFKLQISPMDCAYVSRIDAITIRPTGSGSTLGTFVLNSKPAGAVDSSALCITMATVKADTLNQWYSDSSMGKIGTTIKRAGQLDFLATDMQPLFTLNFTNLAISGISMSLGGTSENMERAEMLWEGVAFSYGAV